MLLAACRHLCQQSCTKVWSACDTFGFSKRIGKQQCLQIRQFSFWYNSEFAQTLHRRTALVLHTAHQGTLCTDFAATKSDAHSGASGGGSTASVCFCPYKPHLRAALNLATTHNHLNHDLDLDGRQCSNHECHCQWQQWSWSWSWSWSWAWSRQWCQP